jgi:hypothetical protein
MASSIPPVSPTADGYIKVCMTFKTYEPKHFRSHILKAEFFTKPPFFESVCVFLRPEQITERGEAIVAAFKALISRKVIPPNSVMTGSTLAIEDTTTLAYLLETP